MNNESEQIIINTYKSQISVRDTVITELKRKNEIQSIIIENQRIKYKIGMFVLSILLIISSGINIYHLLL